MTSNQAKTLSEEDRRRIDEAIDKRRAEMAALDWDLLNDSVGVRQADDAIRKALDKVIERVEANDYHEVARLGYEDVSSGYVFLQRVMGGMQMNAHKKSELISRIAAEVGLTYEQAEPQAEGAFERARSEIGNRDDSL